MITFATKAKIKRTASIEAIIIYKYTIIVRVGTNIYLFFFAFLP